MFIIIKLKISYVLDPNLLILLEPKSDDKDEFKAECKNMNWCVEDTF